MSLSIPQSAVNTFPSAAALFSNSGKASGESLIAQSNNPSGLGAKLAVRPSNETSAAGGAVRQEVKLASAAGRSESMAQAFAGNRVPKGTAQANVDMLLRYSGFKPPSKNPSLGERFWGNDWDKIGAALRVAGKSVNERNNPGFHFDEKSGSLLFANSKQGAQAFKSFMVKFTDLTTDRNGNYTKEAAKFIKEGLPLLSSQFGGTMVKELQKIEQEVKANENSGPVRYLTALSTISNVLQQVAAVRGGGRGTAPQVVRVQANQPQPTLVGKTGAASTQTPGGASNPAARDFPRPIPAVVNSVGRTKIPGTASLKVRQNFVPQTDLQQAQRSKPNRSASALPYKPGDPITGAISVRPGINLAKLGEFKTSSLADIAKRTGVPEGELRVLVLVRHGESLANKGNTFAGNNPGVVTQRGGFARPDSGTFTAMPNGEVLPPGGNISLSNLGKQQATDANVLVGNLRALYPIKTAMVSPVHRAQQTFDLMTKGQSPFEVTQTVPRIAERGMGRNVGNSKTTNQTDFTRSTAIKLDGGRQVGTVGGKKVAGDTAVTPNSEGGVNMARPISDQTGYEDPQTFNGRISLANNETVLPALIKGGVIETSHQYTIAATLKRIDPRIDTMKLGHGIPNGQPLVVFIREQPQADGKPPKLTVVEAGYYRGNAATNP